MSETTTEANGTATCRLVVNDDRGVAYLYQLASSSPGNGDGGRLLAQVIAKCEDLGVELRLHTDVPRLVSWYVGYGFTIESFDPDPFWGWGLVRHVPANV